MRQTEFCGQSAIAPYQPGLTEGHDDRADNQHDEQREEEFLCERPRFRGRHGNKKILMHRMDAFNTSPEIYVMDEVDGRGGSSTEMFTCS